MVPLNCRPSWSATWSWVLPATTCLFVTIQPFESKITPEPMPVDGIWPNGSFGFPAAPDSVIVTIAGDTLAAAVVIADCSSITMGCDAVTVCAWTAAGVAAGRSRDPDARRSPYVPSEASVAETSDAATMTPTSALRTRPPPRGAPAGTGGWIPPPRAPVRTSARGWAEQA